MKAGWTDGLTDGQTDCVITICLPKFLWGHKNRAGGGGVRTKLPKCQLLTILNYQRCYQMEVET